MCKNRFAAAIIGGLLIISTSLTATAQKKFSLLVLILFCTLLIYSPGKSTPFLDESGKPLLGSISEKIHININGIKQGMIIKSKDSTHPVLLYLHGGLPDYFLTRKYPTGLEDYFTVVWWERRGSGLSYNAGIPPQEITLAATAIRYKGGNELSAQTLCTGKNLSHGTFGRNFHWHTSGCTNA